jgi:3-phenylpropionate/cinnamic acid dioxygenase small subunit
MAKEMADRQAIADLFSEYAWALDAKDWDLLRQVFHEDASLTLELTGPTPSARSRRGRRWSAS